MAIRNRDGSLYKLTRPNPLAKDQEQWGNDLIVHNMGWEEEMVEEENRIPMPALEPIIKIKKPVLTEERAEVSPALPNPELKVEPVPVLKPRKKTVSENAVVMHCQPAIIKQHHDMLYNETHTRIEYGEKTQIETIILELGDLAIRFKTEFPLTKGSVVFPSKFTNGEKFFDQRWWKVQKVSQMDTTWIAQGIVSDYQPDFT